MFVARIFKLANLIAICGLIAALTLITISVIRADAMWAIAGVLAGAMLYLLANLNRQLAKFDRSLTRASRILTRVKRAQSSLHGEIVRLRSNLRTATREIPAAKDDLAELSDALRQRLAAIEQLTLESGEAMPGDAELQVANVAARFDWISQKLIEESARIDTALDELTEAVRLLGPASDSHGDGAADTSATSATSTVSAH